jgi:hypothetical protein
MTLLGFPEKGMSLSCLVVSSPSTETLGLKIAYECTTSFSAPRTNFKFHFREFWIFGPRVSRVLQLSAEILVLGFLQLIEEVFHLTSVILTLKDYCW